MRKPIYAASVLFVGVVSSTSQPAAALTIVPLYDASVLAQPQAAQWQSAFNFASAEIARNFSDPITITIKVVAQQGSFGANSATLIWNANNYSTVKAALVADARTVDDATAIDHLPLTDPGTVINGGTGATLWGTSFRPG